MLFVIEIFMIICIYYLCISSDTCNDSNVHDDDSTHNYYFSNSEDMNNSYTTTHYDNEDIHITRSQYQPFTSSNIPLSHEVKTIYNDYSVNSISPKINTPTETRKYSFPKTAPHIFINGSSRNMLPSIAQSRSYITEYENDDIHTQSSEYEPFTPLEHPIAKVHGKKGRLASIKERLINIYQTNIVKTLRCLRLKNKANVFRKMSSISSEYSYYQLV